MDSTARAALTRQLDTVRRGPLPAPVAGPVAEPAAHAFRRRVAQDYRAAIDAEHRDNLAELPGRLAAAARREQVSARPIALTDRRAAFDVVTIDAGHARRVSFPPVP